MSGLVTGWGEFELGREPGRRGERAWDSADEYLLRELAGRPAGGTVAVVGDRWGALSVALAGRPGGGAVVQISDSVVCRRITGTAGPGVRLLSAVEDGPARVDTLVVRVPKSLAFLEDQLARIRPALHPDSVVVGTGRVKEIHTSTLEVFGRAVGPTTTSLAWRKSRLIFSAVGERVERSWPRTYDLPEGIGVMSGRPVVNHAGIFCADRLDIGTRLLLGHVGTGRRIVDLGCGNGVVGTAAALANPGAGITFTDESYSAVAAAEATFRANCGQRAASFVVSDCMDDVPAGSADLVLCNPPFHQHVATDEGVAWRMFTNARRVLEPGGRLVVVGNRHLGYHVKLRRLFGTAEVVASNPKFVVLEAVR